MTGIKINTIIIVGLFSVLALTSCNKTKVEQPTLITKPLETIEVDTPKEINELSDKDADAYFEDQANKARDTYANAVQHYDEEMCENLESEAMQFSCTQNILMVKASATHDISLCEELGTEESIEQCEDLYDLKHPEAPESFFSEPEGN